MRVSSILNWRWAVLIGLSGLSAVYGQRTLSLSPSPIFLRADVNGAQAPTSVTVRAGDDSEFVNFQLPSVPWLSINAVLVPNNSSLTVTANPAGLAAGVYTTTIEASDAS